MSQLLKRFRAVKERVYDAIVFHYYAHDARKRGRKYVVMGNPMVGIGNRLIALANTYAWFGKENISLVWSMDSWVPSPFEDLFEMTDAPGFEVVSHKRNRWSRYLQLPQFPTSDWKWWQFWAPPKVRSEFKENSLRCLYDKTPEELIKLFLPFFKQLKPSVAVQKRIDECKLPTDVVCVQIRNTKGQGDIALVASPETFLKKMVEYRPEQKFFVSCMNAEMSKMVHNRFGDRVIELPNKNYKSMVDAVADMWLLGAGKELICQYPSTFGEVAWWWHGARTKVTGINFEYRQDN